MDQLFNLLKGFAPAIATAVAGPLGGAAVAIVYSVIQFLQK
tara:strand:+ start:754 stop:876 length:123 start_codon:yes stop_codon:yes gene_type:complete